MKARDTDSDGVDDSLDPDDDNDGRCILYRYIRARNKCKILGIPDDEDPDDDCDLG